MRAMIALVTLGWLPILAPAAAQDVAGIEDCTKTQGLDRRTGCLQSNVNLLQRNLVRNASEAHRRLQAAEGEIVRLKAALGEMQKEIRQLRAGQKAAPKPDPRTK